MSPGKPAAGRSGHSPKAYFVGIMRGSFGGRCASDSPLRRAKWRVTLCNLRASLASPCACLTAAAAAWFNEVALRVAANYGRGRKKYLANAQSWRSTPPAEAQVHARRELGVPGVLRQAPGRLAKYSLPCGRVCPGRSCPGNHRPPTSDLPPSFESRRGGGTDAAATRHTQGGSPQTLHRCNA